MYSAKLFIKIFILLLIFTHSIHSQLNYSFSDTLYSPRDSVFKLDVTQNSQILVAASEDYRAYVFRNQGGFYQLFQTLSDSRKEVYVTDITSDGIWLLVVDFSGRALVYKANRITKRFSLFQSLNPKGDSSSSYAGAMTDDHQLLAYGKGNGRLYIYEFRKNKFKKIQHIKEWNDRIISIAITNDHQFMAVSTNGKRLYIYKHNGKKFIRHQSMKFSSNAFRILSLTDDHMYLSVSTVERKGCTVFKFINDEFSEIKHFSSSSYTYHCSFNINQNSFAISTKSRTEVYDHTSRDRFYFSESFTYSNSHVYSFNSEYLFTGKNSSINIYKSPIKEVCSIDFCILCKNSTACSVCSSYENKVLNFSAGTCDDCPLEGCLSCKNLSVCSECDYEKNYFPNSNSGCTKCQLPFGCKQCQSLSSCGECLSSFFKNLTGQCEKCSLENCLECTSFDKCSMCDEGNGYFLNNEKKCQVCQISDCQTCKNLTYCTRCFETEVSETGQCCALTDSCHPQFWLLIFLPILGAVVIASVVILILVFCKKKQNNQEGQEKETERYMKK